MSTDGGGAEQIGPSRLHVPGQPPPGAPQFRNMVVRDTKGNTFAMPFAYMAAMDENAAKQIYHVVRSATTDALKDFAAGVAALIAQALVPQQQPTQADDDNPDRRCAAPLATGMCNQRRADHPIEGHEFVPGALVADDQGVPSLDIAPPVEAAASE